MEETVDVVQCVVKCKDKFLLGERSSDGFWEFFGGKVEESVSLKDAAFRELKEETNLDLSEEEILEFRKGDSYRSSDNEKYRLNPVFIKLKDSFASFISTDKLSNKHCDFAWIDLTNFDNFKTLGQYKALEHLDIVNGRVASAAIKKNDKYLIVRRSSDNSTPGKWSFISGGIENGETVEQAAKREVKEETSLKAEPVEKGEFFIGQGEKGYWRIEPVKMKYISGEIDMNWELSNFEWVKPKEIEDFNTIGKMKALENIDTD